MTLQSLRTRHVRSRIADEDAVAVGEVVGVAVAAVEADVGFGRPALLLIPRTAVG
jgi:hypothetical protein